MCDLECGFGGCYYGSQIGTQRRYLQDPQYGQSVSWLNSFQAFLQNTEAELNASNCDHLLARAAIKLAYIELACARRKLA